MVVLGWPTELAGTAGWALNHCGYREDIFENYEAIIAGRAHQYCGRPVTAESMRLSCESSLEAHRDAIERWSATN